MRHQLPAGSWLLLGAIVAVGLNLRGPIVAVSPVLDDLQRDTQATEASAGLLTAVPVLCFAAVSPFVAMLARRIGTDLMVVVCLVLVGLGIAVRPWAGFGLLLAGTVLIGAAIAGGNVLLPVVARRDFANRTGPVMSAVTTSMLVSASAPAMLTVPLAAVVGWRAALALWAVLAAVALGVWALATGRTGTRGTGEVVASAAAGDRHPAGGAGAGGGPVGGAATPEQEYTGPVPSAWRAPAAWQLGVFFGLQALLFYATTAWLPTMLQADGGLDAATAGTALSVFQFLGLAGALAVPVLIRGRYLRYIVVAVIGALWAVFFAGLLLAPGGWLLWCTIGGVTQGGGLAMGLGLIAVRSSSSDAASTVSAMVQTVGYCLAAAGPVALGAITAATAGWTVPFTILIVLSVLMGVVGVRSAGPRPIR